MNRVLMGANPGQVIVHVMGPAESWTPAYSLEPKCTQMKMQHESVYAHVSTDESNPFCGCADPRDVGGLPEQIEAELSPHSPATCCGSNRRGSMLAGARGPALSACPATLSLSFRCTKELHHFSVSRTRWRPACIHACTARRCIRSVLHLATTQTHNTRQNTWLFSSLRLCSGLPKR